MCYGFSDLIGFSVNLIILLRTHWTLVHSIINKILVEAKWEVKQS